jgi:flagellar motor protein MotB
MLRIRTPYLIIILSLAIALFSCTPQKKIVSGRKDLSVVDSQLLKYGKTLNELDAKRKNKQQQNEIDDTASARIKKFIDRTDAEIKQLHDTNTVLIFNTSVKKEDWDRLRKNLSLTRNASKRINDKISLLSDLINRNTVVNLDQDLLFEPGQYTVTPAVAQAIGKFFEPAAKEIDLFIKKYPDFPLSLVITAKGYADGTTIAEGSSLFKDLKARLKLSGREPDNKELNKELSRARANEVYLLFKKFTDGESGNGLGKKNILFFYEGKGEALPNPKITDYKTDDPRRRVVLLFWSVFPD